MVMSLVIHALSLRGNGNPFFKQEHLILSILAVKFLTYILTLYLFITVFACTANMACAYYNCYNEKELALDSNLLRWYKRKYLKRIIKFIDIKSFMFLVNLELHIKVLFTKWKGKYTILSHCWLDSPISILGTLHSAGLHQDFFLKQVSTPSNTFKWMIHRPEVICIVWSFIYVLCFNCCMIPRSHHQHLHTVLLCHIAVVPQQELTLKFSKRPLTFLTLLA